MPENSGRYESSGQRALLATTESWQAELAEDSREFLRHSTVGVATRNPRSVGFLDDDEGIGRTMKTSQDKHWRVLRRDDLSSRRKTSILRTT